MSYQKGSDAYWNEDATFIPYDPDDLDEKTERKYSKVDEDGRRYQLTSLINPNPDRPNLKYEFLGVTRTWRWTRERMEAAYAAGEVVQTAPGNVPRQKRHLDEQRGKPLGDVWTDISPLNSQASERLGYPTQKPLELLERIIEAACPPDGVVMDPFAGCGTTIDAAERLGRNWIGVDVTYLSVDLITKRLRDTHGDEIMERVEVHGIPRDLPGAKALFEFSPFDFERWAVSLVNGQPNEKQVGDKGVDGVIRFPLDREAKKIGRVLVSVKGGKSPGPTTVRDLAGTVEAQRAEMGVLVTLAPPTKGMSEAAQHSGLYTWPWNDKNYPKVQIITVDELLAGERIDAPQSLLPYVEAKRQIKPIAEDVEMF